jgi:hypothetical protein
MMSLNSKKLIVPLVLGSALASNSVFSQDLENNVSVSYLKTDKTDYVSKGVGVSTDILLSFGKVSGVFEKECGETRIDPYKNIFSFAVKDVQPWIDYCSEKKGVKFGTKLPVFGGDLVLGAGYGVQDFLTDNNSENLPGKDISLSQTGFKVGFEKGDFSGSFKFKKQEEGYSLDLVSGLGPINNATDKNRNISELDIDYSNFSLNVLKTSGSRSDEYSHPLLGDVEHNYSGTRIYTGMKFGDLEIGPAFRGGSVEGSYTSIKLDSGLVGVMGEYSLSENSGVNFGFESYSGSGSRGLFPISNEISESLDKKVLSLSYFDEDLKVSFSRSESDNSGSLSANGMYAMILRGKDFSNSRDVVENNLIVSKQFNNFGVSVLGISRKLSESQYGRVDSVSEKELRVGLNYKF